MYTGTDRIEKKILLKAPLDWVWRALSDSTEFGTRFWMKLEGAFTPGATMHGIVVGTRVIADVANVQAKHQGKPIDITIEQMIPGLLFSFSWHPHAVEPGVDYSAERTTLVEFSLEEVSGGVAVTLTESGFDRIPLARRAQAFTSNEQGWGIMLPIVGEYLAQVA